MKLKDYLDLYNQRLAVLESFQPKILTTLERNTMGLEEHIRRTEILEAELRPIKTHVAVIGAFAKILGVLASGAAAGTGIIKLVHLFRG